MRLRNIPWPPHVRKRPGRRRSPRPKRTGWRRLVPSWKSVLGGCGLLALGLVTLLWVGYARTPLPTEPQDGVTDQGSVVYYADGKTPILRLGANREKVALARIPEHLRWAVLAAEDRGFYSEHGVSPMGLTRAVWANATGGAPQGGSTITQQLARNYYKGLSRDRTFGRKFREFFVAIKLDRHKSKDEILDLYLNTVYFGRQSSGVQAAARAYFHKDVWNLDVAQSALLAAMIQQPGYFHSQGDSAPARALRARWQYVINGMVSMGKLSRTAAAGLKFPTTQKEWTAPDRSGQSELLRQRLMAELQRLGVPTEAVLNGGLKIYTGIDKSWMEHAAAAMRQAKETRWPERVRAGLVAVDPRDGAIKAFYGGDPRRSQFDTVFNPGPQAGSTFKPYVLAAALRQGFNVRSLVPGASPVRFAPDGQYTPLQTPGYLVNNDEKIGSLGPVDLITATAMSVNTGYVKLGFAAGLDQVRRAAQDFGVPATFLDPFKGQAGITLGTATIPPVHQAAGYAAFANGGTAVTPHLITRIVDPDGASYPLPWGRPGKRVLTREQAAQATVAMRATVNNGTGRRAALADREVAGKTGTTDQNRAAWFVGYVPRLSTAVTMFDTKGKTLRDIPGWPGVVSGESAPAEIWRSFMQKVGADLPYEQFTEPAFTGKFVDLSVPPPPGTGVDEAGCAGKPGCRIPADLQRKARLQGTPPPPRKPCKPTACAPAVRRR